MHFAAWPVRNTYITEYDSQGYVSAFGWGGGGTLNIYLINKGVVMGVVVGMTTVFALIRKFS